MKLAVGMLAFACALLFAPQPGSAQQRAAKCNELPYAQCVKCAIGRGFKPEQYEPYCRKR